MKNIHLYILAFSFLFIGLQNTQAQVDRSYPPKPTEARSVDFGDVTEMRFKNGLTVLVVENHKLPTVDFNIYFNNGPIYEGAKAGYASFMGDMMRSETENYSKAQLDEAMDYLGTDFYFSGSSAGFSSLKNKFNESMDLFTEVLFRPTFNNQDELDKLKKQQITALESDAKNPDVISRNVEGVLLYGKNDPYGEMITEETINNINLQDFKDLYKERVIPNNAFLTFVGDITPDEIKTLVVQNFKKWKKNKKFEKKNYPVQPNKSGNYIAFVDLPDATQSVINIVNLNDYKKSNSDYFAAKLGNSILGGGSSGRLFKNIREDKGWTYGAYSRLDDSYERLGKFSASAKVRNAVTDSAIVEFMKEIKGIGSQAPSADELSTKKAEYNGNFVLQLERPSTVGNFTRNIIIENLPSDFYKNYLKGINATTGAQISQAMKKYTNPDNLVVLVVGKGAEVVPQLEKLGMPIKYYNNQGDEIEKPKFTMEVPQGMTATDVLEKAIQARGGMDKLNAIKSLRSVYTGNVQGQDLRMTMQKMAPNYVSVKIELPAMGMTAMEQKFDGNKGTMAQMGQSQEMPAEMVDAIKKTVSPIDELNLWNIKNKLELTTIVPVEGKNAYVLEYEENGAVQKNYFDLESGLLSQTINSSKDPSGNEVSIIQKMPEYRAIEGIQIPNKIIQNAQGMDLIFMLDSAEINPNIPLSDFQ